MLEIVILKLMYWNVVCDVQRPGLGISFYFSPREQILIFSERLKKAEKLRVVFHARIKAFRTMYLSCVESIDMK